MADASNQGQNDTPSSDIEGALVTSILGILGGAAIAIPELRNSTAFQIFLWRVIGGVLEALTQPFLVQATQDANSHHPTVALSPQAAADMLIRGVYTSEEDAAKEASLSGIDADRFHKLALDTGEVPSPLDLARMLFRGIIVEGPLGAGKVSYVDGFRESRLRTEWLDAVKEYALETPSALDAVNAEQRGVLDHTEANTLYQAFGGHPEFYQMLLDLAGEPISVGEAARLAYRGIIPWEGIGPDKLSVQQAVAEGRTKNKYWTVIQQLTQYYPPPRTITAMVREGGLTKEQAIAWWQAAGMDAATAEIYWGNASTAKTATAKQLSESLTIKLYSDHIIDQATATGLLNALGYDAAEAAFILEVQNATLYEANVSAAITHIRTLYLAHKMDTNTAAGLLAQLGVLPDQVSQLINLWDSEITATLALLTRAEIVDAWKYAVLTPDEAMTELGSLGYTPYDAWVLLATANESAVNGQGKGYKLPPAPPKTAIVPVPQPGG